MIPKSLNPHCKYWGFESQQQKLTGFLCCWLVCCDPLESVRLEGEVELPLKAKPVLHPGRFAWGFVQPGLENLLSVRSHSPSEPLFLCLAVLTVSRIQSWKEGNCKRPALSQAYPLSALRTGVARGLLSLEGWYRSCSSALYRPFDAPVVTFTRPLQLVLRKLFLHVQWFQVIAPLPFGRRMKGTFLLNKICPSLFAMLWLEGSYNKAFVCSSLCLLPTNQASPQFTF